MDWKQEVLKRLDALAEKLGTTSAYLWQVLIKQGIAVGIADAVVAILSLIVGLVLLKLTFFFMRKHKQERHEMWDFWAGVSVVVEMIAFSGFSIYLYDAILELYNPQYYALHEILQALGK